MRSLENNPPGFTRIPLAALGVGLGFPGVLIGAMLGIVFSPSRKLFEAPAAFVWVVLGILVNLAALTITVT